MRRSAEFTISPCESGSENLGARAPAARARPANPEAMSSAVERRKVATTSGGAVLVSNSAVKASSLSCSGKTTPQIQRTRASVKPVR